MIPFCRSRRVVVVAATGLAAFAVLAGGGAPARAQALVGSEDLASLVAAIIASCPGAASISYQSDGTDAAEDALMSGAQEIAPMARFLDTARTCATATPQEAEGLLVALDAATVLANAGTASVCPGASVGVASVAVTDANGTPGLQCPGCVGTTYTLTDWRDGLRVLLAGLHHDAGSALAAQDCNSDVRHALARDWRSLFGSSCPGATCGPLWHLWRPSDRSGTSELLLALLGLPAEPSNVFCNATGAAPPPSPAPANHELSDFLDQDPIRRACQPGESVCRRDGTLGLVLPIDVPSTLSVAKGYPTAACSVGTFRLLRPAVIGVTTCPNGLGLLFGKCFQPTLEHGDGTFSASCLAATATVQPYQPNGMDGRAYNLVAKNDDGSYLKDARGRMIKGAFFRVHTSAALPGGTGACRQASTTAQLGCLAQASPCSLGVGTLDSPTLSGAAGVAVAGIAPSLASVRRLVASATDPLAYPLATRLLLTSVVGLDALVDSSDIALSTCLATRSLVEPAATAAGVVTLGADPSCVDFDERPCSGALFNQNACLKRAVDWCPDVDGLTASPLQVAVGGTISLDAQASDLDGDSLDFLWTATAGTFADPTAPTTTYRCTTVGAQTLTFRVWDGQCETDQDVPITCV